MILENNAYANIEVSQFDDLKPGYTLAKPYQHLSFFNLTVKSHHELKGLLPHSKPKYAASGPFPRALYPAPYWTTSGTKTTSFDMKELWVGCVDARKGKNATHAATTCQFTVQCTSPVAQGQHEGPYLESYTPASASTGAGAAMMLYTPSFTYCTAVELSLYTSDAGTQTTLLVVDSLSYTIREGEVFS